MGSRDGEVRGDPEDLEGSVKGLMPHRRHGEPIDVRFVSTVTSYMGIADNVHESMLGLHKEESTLLTQYVDLEETVRISVPHAKTADGKLVFNAQFTGYKPELAESLLKTYFKNPVYQKV